MSRKPSPPYPPKPSPPDNTSSPPSTMPRAGRWTYKLLTNLIAPFDVVGRKFLGDYWWTTIRLSIQDTIALSFLLKGLSAIGHFLTGQEFSGLDVCFKESEWNVSRYACFVIVGGDLALWIVIAGRMLGRFFVDLKSIHKSK
jgi:hypothetical protein